MQPGLHGETVQQVQRDHFVAVTDCRQVYLAIPVLEQIQQRREFPDAAFVMLLQTPQCLLPADQELLQKQDGRLLVDVAIFLLSVAVTLV